MNDQVWQSVRYLLIAGGAYLAGRGKLPMEQVAPLADSAVEVLGAAVSLGSAAWGFYVKFRTRAVPEKTAARADVPTTSPITGAVERTSSRATFMG